jgi:hypothetical protein
MSDTGTGEPAVAPASHVAAAEFFARDRYHAATHLRSLNLPDELATAILRDLNAVSPAQHVLVAYSDGGAHHRVMAFGFVTP